MKFYNTINLSGEELRQAVANARKQEHGIFLIYINTRKPFTASEITQLTEKAGLRYPLWSNRRAITNLMNQNHLVKLNQQKMGPMGKPEYQYQINAVKYPTKQGEQQEMFR